ncbi:hypothetical protein JQ633_33405 [Bradyrhizobium tropiciagri]|uniref:DUF6894 family protein n=1 Tax=Bradyrhizobium tropiciagri TaxID=312253 RepID=UPI001BA4B6BF|nr:hypothetical protein [Bradyrhizobium tropiciagri]MBR0875298.1 hypothetical protein [Bradyrhizobium tropiciagri]
MRYFFDIRDTKGLYPDEEGIELPDERAAKVEAAQTLAGLAKDAATEDGRSNVSIEVRSEEGWLFHAAFVFQEGNTKH